MSDVEQQNTIRHLQNRMSRGELTADQANVELVRAERVRLITSSIPAETRKALNAAVKRGELGHLKKDGRKPEAYYHPSFKYLVPGLRNAHERQTIAAIAKICG